MIQTKKRVRNILKRKQLIFLLGTSLLSGALMTGCQTGEALAYTGEEMVEKAIEENKKPFSYYAEAEMNLIEGDKRTESMSIKEWYNAENGNMRNEIATQGNDQSVSVNDGNQIIVYEKARNTAYIMDAEVVGPLKSSPKEKMLSQLERMRSTHSIEPVAKEKWLGNDVYHIKATPLEEGKSTLIGSQEYWVNAKNWMVVKSKVTTGDITSEFAYKLLDESPEFTTDTFKLELPENVEMISMEDFGPKAVTVEEAEAALGHSFLQLPAERFNQISVEMFEGSGELERTEVMINYLEEGKTPLSLSVFKSPENEDQEEEFGEPVIVRGHKGEYIKEIEVISWDEEGLRYSLMAAQQSTQNKVDQLLEWAELLTDTRPE
ncbi:outer membrane lipoprotein carrier protein LolA [Paenibacillus sp. p3-SID867]|uniref:LolA family protein n=1 Tax=Paenibacillus sp. p3-SID867 TaxID=2916363 RepID=UPI0021A7497E|nr:outer membrane lipoprotein carrier protein LolA [Paenibacillus sp. p3-SID867]MCT1401878.1 outer membrane lipoprotein carrier protein LolA [Paenibacillus sp. p3-SID867]